jgi:hypothetical protein
MTTCSQLPRFILASLFIFSLGCWLSNHSNIELFNGTRSTSNDARNLTFFATTDDDRHNPNVNPRNATNVPLIPLFSKKPSKRPSRSPTRTKSRRPTVRPRVKPSTRPIVEPTSRPTIKPVIKSFQPTFRPTVKPVVKPSTKPTSRPTVQPTIIPSVHPSATSTIMPTLWPTLRPSAKPYASCSSSTGSFGDTNGTGIMLVSYSYELVVKTNNIFTVDGVNPSKAANLTSTIGLLENAILNQVISSIITRCMNESSTTVISSNRKLQNEFLDVLGLSSSPEDLIAYGSCFFCILFYCLTSLSIGYS